jgi:hypothetical protein
MRHDCTAPRTTKSCHSASSWQDPQDRPTFLAAVTYTEHKATGNEVCDLRNPRITQSERTVTSRILGSTVLVQKLVVAQLIKKLPAFRVHNTSPLFPVLSQINQIFIFFFLLSVLSLPFHLHLGFQKNFFASRFPTQIVVFAYHFSHHCYFSQIAHPTV